VKKLNTNPDILVTSYQMCCKMELHSTPEIESVGYRFWIRHDARKSTLRVNSDPKI
jgi:hypothetical protein